MDQSRNEEDHKFSGQNTQQLDIIKILLDDEAFENMFFPPTSMDYNPMNINEYIDFDELHELLNEEKVNEGVHFVVGNEGGLDGKHGSNMVATQINNGDRSMNVKLTDEQNVKKWDTRKRYKKGSEESAQMRELKRIRNRDCSSCICRKAGLHPGTRIRGAEIPKEERKSEKVASGN
ncbi:hypothetical protein CRYUN_Cryun23aG0104500 [Craigia yunnanensis]